jgi:DNA-directed RNA polymerase specialized sigma24 family protein
MRWSDGENVHMSVGVWILLFHGSREKAGRILDGLARQAVGGTRRWAGSAEDAAQELILRLLRDDLAALLRVRDLNTPLYAWLLGAARNLQREKAREKTGGWIDDVADQAPGPHEIAADRDNTALDRAIVVEVAHSLPAPYGHVLVWRLLEGVPWKQIRIRLNAHRGEELCPISDRQAQKLVTEAVKMLQGSIRGTSPRVMCPQRYFPKKNPWISAKLPPLGPPIP